MLPAADDRSYNKPDRETKPTKDEAAEKLMETLRQELIEEGFLEADSIFSSGELYDFFVVSS